MMYNIFAAQPMDWDELKAAVADQFSVALEDVEVAASDELEARNWDARVSCELQRTLGDVSWMINIYATDNVVERPTESVLAACLAGRLKQPILFPDPSVLPSAYWVADSLGNVARARLYSSDEQDFTYRIDVVDAPILGLPDTPVARIPEAIRLLSIETPRSDEFRALLGQAGNIMPDPEGTSDLGGGYRGLAGDVESWERLAVRMSQNWPPYSWYPADFYSENLRIRDRLKEESEGRDSKAAELADSFIADIDEVYRRLTVDDSGAALASAIGEPASSLAERDWWWHRRPVALPWDE
ncbi:hypothetical protein [Kitasatospora sp. McL0602]|uniref:hypothetical protein n=1 Tax=Kitasatospora sp. McL0602 TaxID=3439530 RepID=UPI003F8C9B8E